MRQNFQTEWGVYWERTAGPLQGALTLKQYVWLIRNHEKTMHEYHIYLYGLAQKVVACSRCNRRQVVHAAGQECKGCMCGSMFTPGNGMSLGPRMQDEARGGPGGEGAAGGLAQYVRQGNRHGEAILQRPNYSTSSGYPPIAL